MTEAQAAEMILHLEHIDIMMQYLIILLCLWVACKMYQLVKAFFNIFF